MAEALLGRIARHGVSSAVDPREDRLTEVLAAVLGCRRCEGLARHLALGWLRATDARLVNPTLVERAQSVLADDARAWSCSVRTQVSLITAAGRRRPDLQLTFDELGDARRRVVIWVEVKHGTDLHSHQLHAYVENLRHAGGNAGAVVLVAPRESYPFDRDEIPAEVPQLTWEDTATILQAFMTTDPVGVFLIAELLEYLKEEKLVDPGPLNAAHLTALRKYRAATRSLVRVCEIAADAVAKLWDQGEFFKWPEHSATPTNYYWAYPLAAVDGTTISAPRGWELQWQLMLDGQDAVIDAAQGVPLLTAGLVSERGGLSKFSAETLENLTDNGLDVLADRVRAKGWDYIVRIADLDQLDVTRSPDPAAQGQRIADWANASFRAIAEVLHEPV